MEQPLNILYIHNRYLFAGGEDVVFENEKRLLNESGKYVVSELVFSNEGLNHSNFFSKFLSSTLILFNPFSFYKVYRKVKQEKIKIVHVHNFYYQATPSIFWAAKLAGARTILTVHNYRLLCISGNLLYKGTICEKCVNSKTLYKGILNRCFQQSIVKSSFLTASNLLNRIIGTMRIMVDYYLVLTPFMSQLLQSSSLRIPKEKIIEKANFISDSGFAVYEERQNFYLYVGRLSAEKGIIQLLNSWKDIDAHLYVVGDGDLKNEVLQFASKNPNIKVLGSRTKPEVIQLMRSCKALVFPSVCYEGMSMTVLEAKSCGTVVIANRTKNIEGLVKHLTNGILYDGNIEEGIRSFGSLSTGEIREMGHQSRCEFEQYYTDKIALEKLSEIYRKICKKE